MVINRYIDVALSSTAGSPAAAPRQNGWATVVGDMSVVLPHLHAWQRSVRTLYPVVQPPATMVKVGKAKVAKCGIVGAVSVSDDRSRHDPPLGCLQSMVHRATSSHHTLPRCPSPCNLALAPPPDTSLTTVHPAI